MTSSNGNIFRVTGLCAGNSPVTGEFPSQKASYAENVSIWWRHHEYQACWYTNRFNNAEIVSMIWFLHELMNDLRLNKQLSKQSCGWWFETSSSSLWRQCNVLRSNRLIKTSWHGNILHITGSLVTKGQHCSDLNKQEHPISRQSRWCLS